MPRIPAFVVAISLGQLLVPLNSTMIVVALPLIARDLGADRIASAWLITSYLIVMASLQPIAGRLGDRYGRRRFMLGSLGYFIVASVGAALAPNLIVLIAFRLQQALAAAGVVPNSLALLRGRAVGNNAGTYFGISGATTSIGAALGPLLGGLLAAFDWRFIFLVNVPLAGLALALGARSLPAGDPPRKTARPDIAGAIALGVLLAAAAWTLTSATSTLAPVTAVGIGLAIALGGVLFVRYELGHPDAALPPRFFAIRGFSAANLTIALSNLALYGTFLSVPVILAGGPDATVHSGIALSVQAIAMIVLSPVSGILVDRVGPRWPTAVGGMLIAAGLGGLAVLGSRAGYEAMLVLLPVTGAGVALTFPATRIAAMDSVPAPFAALASGVTSSSRYFGGIIGALVAGIALADTLAPHITMLFAILAASGLAAGVVGLWLPSRTAPADTLGVRSASAD